VTSRDARVLVVDESKTGRAWGQQALSGVARLETCDSAAAALEVVANSPVDLVVWSVSDESDEDGVGTRLVERLRREHPSVDVVLLADSPPADSGAGGSAGVDWLARPTTPDLFRRFVEQALLRRRLVERNRSLDDRLRTIEKCRVLIPCLDAGEVYPVVLDLLLELMSRRRGIVLYRRTSPLAEALAFRGFSEAEASRLRQLLTEQKPIDPARYDGVDRVEDGPVHSLFQDAGVQVHSFLSVPIGGEEDEAGIVWIFDDGQPFSQQEVDRTGIVSDYARAALHNVERYRNAKERAFIDDVTEIYNVRYLLSTTENEIQRADRYKNPLSVLFLDLDRFKLVNDRYGHLIGSQTLRSLSQLFLQCVRQVDTLARYGGDEFTILLVDTGHDAAMTIAQRIRRTVEANVFEAGAEAKLRLTISIGVATFPEHARERDALLDAADKAMYRAKSLGRNRACSASDL
jgi:two-component system cell cycle response regulator